MASACFRSASCGLVEVTKDKTLVRLDSVSQATGWDADEWSVLAKDSFGGLGAHTHDFALLVPKSRRTIAVLSFPALP